MFPQIICFVGCIFTLVTFVSLLCKMCFHMFHQITSVISGKFTLLALMRPFSFAVYLHMSVKGSELSKALFALTAFVGLLTTVRPNNMRL